MAEFKICPMCKTMLPIEDFPRDRSRVSGRYPYCKNDAVALQQMWRDKNPDKHKAIVKRRIAKIKNSRPA